jgi:hypothetical protein
LDPLKQGEKYFKEWVHWDTRDKILTSLRKGGEILNTFLLSSVGYFISKRVRFFERLEVQFLLFKIN